MIDDTGDDGGPYPTPVREGDEIAKKYVAGGVLGVGGMGVVIAAHDKLLERKVAIKFLHPRLATSERAVQRFIREARAATRITSEHVVKLLEIDTLPSGVPFLVMEHLEGRDLRAVLAESGPLPSAEAVDHILQALQAVAEGHLKRIVHRDLKPSNLFLTRRADGSPLIKVLDYGIAKTRESEGGDELTLTASEDVRLGSPAYMPPEQLHTPSQVDLRCDIWALGVTLHELVCGELPFHGQTYADLVYRITSGEPESARTKRPDLDARLEAVIRRCLQRDRDLRWGSALELATALAPFGTDDARASLKRIAGLGTPVESPSLGPPVSERNAPSTCTTTLSVVPLSRPSRSRRMARGLRSMLLLGGAALVIAGIVAVGSSWQHRAADEHPSPPAPAAATPAPLHNEPAVAPPPLHTEPAAAAPAPAGTASTTPSAEPQSSVASMASASPRTAGPPKPSAPVKQAAPPIAPVRRVTGVPTEGTSAPVETASARVELPSPPSAPSTRPAVVADDDGRSDVIEKLIENRR